MLESYEDVWALYLKSGTSLESRRSRRRQARCSIASSVPKMFLENPENVLSPDRGTFWKFHFRITIAIFWPIKPSWCNSPTLNFITWLSKRSAFQAINKYKKKWSRNLPRSLFSGELKQQRQRWLRKRLISALKKWIYVASKFIALIPSRLIRQMHVGKFFWSWILKDCIKFRQEKDSCCLVFPSSTDREIRHFHVVVVQ